jgi:hypothetical protein
MDIVARVERNDEGLISSGELVGYDPVDLQLDEFEAWKRWHRETAPEWDDVEDIERDLGNV